jgi:hypothetical protein
MLVVADRLDHSVFVWAGTLSGGLSAWLLYERQEANKVIKRFDMAAQSVFDRFIVSMRGQWRMAFYEDGVLSQGELLESKWAWKGFYGVEICPTYVVLRGLAAHIALPKSCLKSDAEINALKSQIESLLERHTCTEWQRIGLYLASNDFACRKCGYSLQGVDGRSCPECCLKLSFENVPAALTASMTERASS